MRLESQPQCEFLFESRSVNPKMSLYVFRNVLLNSIAVISLLSACSTSPNPTALPATNALNRGQQWKMNFAYSHSIAGKLSTTEMSVEQNDVQVFDGELRCVRAVDDRTGTKFECSGTGTAQYSSFASCSDSHGMTSHKEEASPWRGLTHGTLTFDPMVNLWAATIDAPLMQVHVVDIAIDGKRTEQDSTDQVISDLDVADAKLNESGLSGQHHEAGETVDELAFGACKTGVNAESEKADLKIEINQ